MERFKETVVLITGVIGGGIVGHLGGWDSGLKFLITVMAIDYFTGLIVAGVFQNSIKTESGALKSMEGWKGLCKKGVTLLMVLIGYQLDVMTNNNFIRDATIFAYVGIELLSIFENVGQMGLPLPESLTKAVDVLSINNKRNSENIDIEIKREIERKGDE